jgi:hypothetical protein
LIKKPQFTIFIFMNKIIASIKSFFSRLTTYFIYISLFIAAFSIALPMIFLAQNQDVDSQRINLAGRERMLSQKAMKDILLFHEERVPMDFAITTISLFDRTLEVLIYGGEISGLTNKMTLTRIPGMDDLEIKNQLLKVRESWNKYKEHLTRYLHLKEPAALNSILADNGPLLEEIETAVYMIELQSKKTSGLLQTMIIVGLSLVMAALAISLLRRRSELRKARKEIADLEKILPICANCKKIRISEDKKDEKDWLSVEDYLKEKKDMLFTHTICPDCAEKLYPELSEKEGK